MNVEEQFNLVAKEYDDNQKEELFQRIYDKLPAGGIFANL